MDAPREPDRPDADAARDDRWTLDGAARKPVPELVGDKVVELVRTGELRPGNRLPSEPELARLFGVARSSVRTGLQRLQARGLIEVSRGQGWFVADEPRPGASDGLLEPMTAGDFDVLEVLETRIALEGQAAALAAVRATPGQRDRIAKLSRAHQEIPFADRDALLEADEEFHAAIADASGNAHLKAMLTTVVPLIAAWRRDSYRSPELHDQAGIDHNQIVVQIRRGDEVGARLTMTSHLMALYKRVQRERGVAPRGRPAEVSFFVDVRDRPDWSEEP
ncbi:FadR/GntR family transcriptional regulator [Pseudonocardia lacus]|uniref:FadR/GntR family transcriptional regulator n=1 Tax=Pseudonocardia lacus TaxID=2835865 RepID=UPI001BDD0D83|nr:FCD domain-containing protein [Pseudonocardia lacus]